MTKPRNTCSASELRSYFPLKDATRQVYGALMWNLGKILQTPEVARMYVGSFWDEDYKCKDPAVFSMVENPPVEQSSRTL